MDGRTSRPGSSFLAHADRAADGTTSTLSRAAAPLSRTEAPLSRAASTLSRVLVAILLASFMVPAGALAGEPAAASAVSATSASTGTQDSQTTVAVKATVDEYTWDELAAIADKIAASEDDEEALQVAESYNLCTPEGKLDGTQVKQVTLGDGTQTAVQIAGFNHDDRSDGSGKAGITFIFRDAVAEGVLDPSGNTVGGWESCGMRSWLDYDFTSKLPTDLNAVIVPVDKPTNNVGQTADADSVTLTSDRVWLFSATELCGEIDLNPNRIGAYDAYDAVMEAEGTQYQLFADCGVACNQSNAALDKTFLPAGSASWTQGATCPWWERSVYLAMEDFFGLAYNGDANHGDPGNISCGVVPGFCIGTVSSAPAAASGSASVSTSSAPAVNSAAAATSASAAASASSATSAPTSVAVKSSVNDYTWDELAFIAARISAAGSEEAALQVAKSYNLCNPDGTLDGTQTKSISLKNGIDVDVQIAGFYHDDKTDGTGKAGITFIFRDAVAYRYMNSTLASSMRGVSIGGWEGSELRAFLDGYYVTKLPDDLEAYVVAVNKLTNNVGETADTASVTVTSDKLWLFSVAELFGGVDIYSRAFGDTTSDDILNREGYQYQLFEDSGVTPYDVNEMLAKDFRESACYWWTRSAYPSGSGYFNGIDEYGVASLDGNTAYQNAVVPGFCL